MDEKPTPEPIELDSLENPAANVEDTPAADPSSSATTPAETPPPPPSPAPTNEDAASPSVFRWLWLRIKSSIRHFSIFLLLFIVLIGLAILIVVIAIQHNRKQSTTTPLTTQTLTQDTLNQLKNSQATIGDPKQILSVESNAVFAGTVLVRQSLDVAGEIRVGGSLNLSGITVGGTSRLDQLQANSIVITGNATVQKSLAVSGNGSFGGTLSAGALDIDSLHVSGDLQLNRHIDAGGSTPSKTDGTALGGGGTSSISGTDTAGTVNINTGNSPSAGCFVTITFRQHFNGTPHVVITPIGSTAASLNYYLNRNTNGFSICTTNAAPAGRNFSFDYIAVD